MKLKSLCFKFTNDNPANNHLFKLSSRHTRKKYKIFKAEVNERRSGVSIVNIWHISYLSLVSSLLILSKYLSAGKCTRFIENNKNRGIIIDIQTFPEWFSGISGTSFGKISFFFENDIPLGLILGFRNRRLLIFCAIFFFEKKVDLKSSWARLAFQNILRLPFENLTLFTSASSGFPSLALL